ncbi:glycoside hydrolase family 3 protein [Lindgomyces ingoldianus]|uniref:Glycoside hydrolase family 3 protein n=1 Tax=Lindgomyces ingoldianus TaxID=673940 RepID=A0ACB6QSF7_9PLEO|nr:glycoside hydrolase family 3 protein [Lindgomyces ingoldianus]KAF2469918.1 glycoside hydrolase family 3 protein [Lindgomyces ingoldianus]
MRPLVLPLGLLVTLGASQGFNGDWDLAYTKATAALAKLSQSDKIGLVSGIGWGKGKCSGNTGSAKSINYPSLCLQDGPLGVRSAASITAFPAGIMAGATWDRDLIRARGRGLGEETKALGIHVILGPVAGPLGQFAQGGRNWEGFSNDPYLAGVATEQTIAGIQEGGAQACVKHYILNEQEKNRETMNSVVNDRTLHELYLWPFAEAVRANVASVMCSYNKFDGKWACENKRVMDELLKKELGFRGYILTDWDAQHSTVDSANTGLDMTMPGSASDGGNVFWGSKLQSAVSGGQVSSSRLDDMVTRILASWYLTKQDSGYPATAIDRQTKNGGPNVQGNHSTIARAVARDGIVLLKNTDGILPLKKLKSIALVGSDAVPNPKGINSCQDMGCNQGTLTMGWGSGSATLPYVSSPADAISARAKKDGASVTLSASDTASQGASAAQKADVAIVFITADSGEEYLTVEGHNGDRTNLNAWHNGEDLVKAVANVNKNTIVVIHSVGPILMEAFADLDSVKAIVWAGLPGQEAGNALTDVLYGDVSPNGKLPYSIAKKAGDYGTTIQSTSDNFGEGLYIDYRALDKKSIVPRYEFGYGLSYTTFNYSNLVITGSPTSGPESGATIPGGASSLFEGVATVTATITNSGTVTAAEVAQLYVGLPDSAPETPVRQLRGFQKLSINAGEGKTVSFSLRRKDLSYWDSTSKKWVLPKGTFAIDVAASSRDLRLSGKITSL